MPRPAPSRCHRDKGDLMPLLPVSLLVGWFLFFAAGASRAESTVDYGQDVRPILSDNCYQCHGPDEETREAGLRLDLKDAALADLESGGRAIVPGNSKASLIIQRITAEDPDERMPPPDSGKTLTPEQIATLKTWIDQGAPWREHWAFVPPKRPAVPSVRRSDWVANPIDAFVLARLEQEGLEPNPPTSKETLIRRVALDLIGLPPTLEEIDAFLADGSPDAYEKLVDRLLASPHYGEHMARYWLDAARYGDTHGLHLDNERSIWPYRDWVIRAFNTNMPFDQFTIEQLAGDLLPNPTIDQLIATGFNRCNVTTSEGGAIAEEFLVRYAVDRTETMGTVWLGLTIGCAVCHEHKFDPISQKEFYELFAYFFSMADPAMDGNALLTPPIVKIPSPEQKAQMEALKKEQAAVKKQIEQALAEVKYADPLCGQELPKPTWYETVWLEDDLPSGAKPAVSGGAPQWQFVEAPEHPVFSGQRATRRSAKGLAQHFFTGASPGLRVHAGDVLFAYVFIDPKDPPQQIMLQFNDGNWEHRAYWGANKIDWGKDGTPSRRRISDTLPEAGRWVRLEVPIGRVGLKPGSVLNGWAFTQFGGTVYWDKAGIKSRVPPEGFASFVAWQAVQKVALDSSLPKPIQDILKTERDKRTKLQTEQLRRYFLEHVCVKTRDVFQPLHEKLQAIQKRISELDKQIPATLISRDLEKRREVYVLRRGEYDKPDKNQKVEPGVPACLSPLSEDAPPNRLGLARWLVDPRHPLTARVTVNRFWQQVFGTGLVKTAEDFGSQGQWPSHPKLLDWLAREFIESGWDVKHMMKLIVTSATYRQSSRVTAEKYRRDPENRLLARGPRFRMDAEMIRDSALAYSGLLVKKIGGKSVKPYQPPGLWEAVGYTSSNTAKFVQDHGEALYRRSLYTFWKRTSPPPSLSAFDAPSRERCTVRRPRTNTPLQALVLMNDVQFVEAARCLAQRMMTEGGRTPEQRIAFAFRIATARRPDAHELAVLVDTFRKRLEAYRRDGRAAEKLVSVGEAPRDASLDVAELAAYTIVANIILNLDETITKS
ncbi:MAG: DUF1553 domain-containing protein [Planctomycetes bacterium]|nr:DUF1553 domain-containing protein [Planctomycetota bacterium]